MEYFVLALSWWLMLKLNDIRREFGLPWLELSLMLVVITGFWLVVFYWLSTLER